MLEHDLEIGGWSVRLSVHMSYTDINSKPRTVGSCGLYLRVAQRM